MVNSWRFDENSIFFRFGIETKFYQWRYNLKFQSSRWKVWFKKLVNYWSSLNMCSLWTRYTSFEMRNRDWLNENSSLNFSMKRKSRKVFVGKMNNSSGPISDISITIFIFLEFTLMHFFRMHFFEIFNFTVSYYFAVLNNFWMEN